MLIPAERQKKILNLIHQQGIMRIANLVDIMGVSHMTIRRDIQKLEEKGKVISVSGGVQLLERLISEPTRDDKSLLFHQQKAAIGLAAANLIPSNATIYLDAGTTTLEIAKHITEREDVLIITNDFGIVDFLIAHGRCDLIHTGGRVCKANRSSVGELSAQFLRNVSIDLAFISTSSWNLQGLTTPDEDKLPVKRAIIHSSQRNILVTDSSKYGKVATFLLYPLDTFDQIICDKALLINAQEKIVEMDIELLLV
ncbi:DeoR/GlpR family DNA-binding transcription regulator [Pasteurella canis]|uniref:DeoR/GlpR family DNA-binding transcription regulator n=1 Tax=Pasteurella canis TaxID=753 RepID=UPI001E2BA047|nr:DeoR/GlpR family DNA-binding transcription regulator [Pasteurella canis]UEA16361.1 DeoR/GlpR family DNA-binding transcription regulator [Pasteurella canis]